MKIKPEHYAQMEQALQRAQADDPSMTLQSYLDRDLTPMRFRWDLLWAASRRGYIKIGHAHNGAGCPVYDYANDSHIDTALKRITDTK